MEAPTNDPEPSIAASFVGSTVAFDHAGKRLVGVVEAKRWVGYTQRGHIPNYELTVRGASGKAMTVDMHAQYVTFRP